MSTARSQQRLPGKSSSAQTNSPRHRSGGFDFTLHLRRLCQDMVDRVDPLRHIDMDRVAIGFCQTRKNTQHGMYASLTPMRFAGGRNHTIHAGRRWTVRRLHDTSGREMLYILNFYLPRFLDLPYREKLTTVMHELWHISPHFDGDVRRFKGRCFAHGASQQRYDTHVGRLVDGWLAARPPEHIAGFLRATFAELVATHGRVTGRKIRSPELVPLK